MACPLWTTNGWPLDVTRVVPTIHCAVTHGGMKEGGIPGHPATVHGSESRDEGMPFSVTEGFGTRGMACPPWTHMTVAVC